ncbi:MAG: hypothetical protein IPI87_16305 [Betaproteobacteria bacterium]|nr:hypothetical protein [Betaproteobacteria bacterium]
MMRYRWRDVPSLFATPVGRAQLIEGVNFRLWPVSSRLARLYRRTLVRRTRVVAIVGSSGKSTTVRAVAAAIDVPTADTLLYNAWGSVSRAMLRIARGQRHAVVEVGIADKGQMRQYARVVQPDATVVTSIGSEHHRSLGSLDVTRDEKAWMVRVLPPGGTAVLNGDDPNVMWMKGETRARIVTFGFGAACDVRAVDARIDWPRGTCFPAACLRGRARRHDPAPRTPHGLRCACRNRRRASRRRAVGRGAGAARRAPADAGTAAGGRAWERCDAPARRLQVAGRDHRRRDRRPRGDPGAPANRAARRNLRAAQSPARNLPAHRGACRARSRALPRRRHHDQGLPARGASRRNGSCARRSGRRHAPRRGGNTGCAARAGRRRPRQGRDTQRLARVCLILLGRRVGCEIRSCHLRTITCDECPMLERGWETHRVVT